MFRVKQSESPELIVDFSLAVYNGDIVVIVEAGGKSKHLLRISKDGVCRPRYVGEGFGVATDPDGRVIDYLA